MRAARVTKMKMKGGGGGDGDRTGGKEGIRALLAPNGGLRCGAGASDGTWPSGRRLGASAKKGDNVATSGEASTFGRREGSRGGDDSWVRGGGAVVLGRDGE